MGYLYRLSDALLQERLTTFGAVLIEGPKWCGKTTTAVQQAHSILSLQDTDHRTEYLTTAATKPSLLLVGDTPRLLDEWQDVPILWDTVRHCVDQRQQVGQFILTGSNSVDWKQILHSGVGRISRLQMYPMSSWEYKESNGAISLKALFDDPTMDIDGITSPLQVEDLIYAACRGGWPATLNISSRTGRLNVARDYVTMLCKEDMSRLDGVHRDERIVRRLLRSYARNISTLTKNTTLLADMTTSEELSVSMNTMTDYITALERLFVIMDVEAWCPAIRSKTTIRSGAKRAFIDPSIAVAVLGLTPQTLQTQLRTFGFIFEQMCIRDIRAYTYDYDTHISYYHDRYGLEADLVVHLADGRYALIECKLGSHDIDMGAEHLLTLQRLVREHNAGECQVPLREPDLLLILTGTSMAYTRPDGVKVIPLGCLKD